MVSVCFPEAFAVYQMQITVPQRIRRVSSYLRLSRYLTRGMTAAEFLDQPLSRDS
jgi:hypothetical protein